MFPSQTVLDYHIYMSTLIYLFFSVMKDMLSLAKWKNTVKILFKNDL